MMIKKYLLHVLVLSVAVLSLQSCITDDSTSPSGNSSKLSLSQDLQQKYTLDRWDTLKIAPKVVQTNAQKDVAYEWEINKKVVSTDAQLNYVCEEFGVFPCRLKVSNGDNIQFYEFELNVQYSYVEGLYILASHGGRTIVSYLPEPQSSKSFDLDVLQKNNPNADFTSAPKSIDYALARDNKTPLVYVAVGNPSTIYELDGNLMTTRFKTTATGNISYLKRSAQTYPKSMLTMVDHVPYRLTLSETSLFDLGKYIKDSLKTEKISLADAATAWKQQDLRYIQGYVLFDNAEGRLVPQKVQATGNMPAQLLKGTFSGDSLIGMGSVDSERNIVLMTWNKAASKFRCYYVSPGYYPSNKTKVEVATLKHAADVPASAGLTKNSVVRVSPEKNLVYYATGNKLYAYNVLSNGHFPTSALSTFGDSGETIVDMLITEGSDRLFVATNAASGSLVGSIYCFDLNENKLLWEKKNITGTIKNITYRQ